MKKNCSRREFCLRAGQGALALAIASPLLRTGETLAKSTSSLETVTLDTSTNAYKALATVGGAITIPDPNDSSRPAIVIRTGTSTVTALSSKCTHQGCEVGLPQSGKLTCPCHSSQFDETGAVLRGPATAPLKKYTASISGTVITVQFSATAVIQQSAVQDTRHFSLVKRGTFVEIGLKDGIRGPVRMEIIDLGGRTIHDQIYENLPIRWDGSAVVKGDYLLRIGAADQSWMSEARLTLP